MTSDRPAVERLRDYLQSLSPRARAMLTAELERAVLRGEDDPGSDLVLQELRRSMRAVAQPVPRVLYGARRFFMPLEPFLFEGPADHKRLGRVARGSPGRVEFTSLLKSFRALVITERKLLRGTHEHSMQSVHHLVPHRRASARYTVF